MSAKSDASLKPPVQLKRYFYPEWADRTELTPDVSAARANKQLLSNEEVIKCVAYFFVSQRRFKSKFSRREHHK